MTTTELTDDKKAFHIRFGENIAENLAKNKGLFPSSNLPSNMFTGSRYTASNMLYLAASGSQSNQWATYSQIRSNGGDLFSGQEDKGTKIQFWKNYDTVDGKQVRLEKPALVMVTVFNLSQTKGLNVPQRNMNVSAAEEFIKSANVVEVTRLTFGRYDRDRDQIQMPSPKLYPNRAHYLRNVIEQMVERTDAQENPSQDVKHNTAEHAANKFKVSIASAIVCDELGIGANPAHDQSLAHKWSQLVRNHPIEAMKIATAAETLATKTRSLEIDTPEMSRATSSDQEPQIAAHRINLNVPFDERKMAESLGASYDGVNNTWYAAKGTDLNALAPWTTTREVGKTNFMDPRDAFSARMKDLGLIVEGEHPIPDGQKHRCKAAGDRPNTTVAD